MIIQKIKIKNIKSPDYNPRIISPEELQKLKNSIQVFGYVEPLIINKQTNNIVGGNQRYKVLTQTLSPEDEVECVIVDLNDAQEKSLNLALNKISGEWNEYKLTQLFKELTQKDNEIIASTGFKEAEIQNLLSVIDSEIPELVFSGEKGVISGLCYDLTFWFENKEDFEKSQNFFRQERTKKPDTKKLLGLIK